MRKNERKRQKKRKHQQIDWQKEEKDQLLIKMCRSCTKKEEENLENDRFSSIAGPKIALLGNMGEHKKGPSFFSGYQNSIPLLISR